ncbi:uncharacterized protein TNCV_2828811 [Trichonephila clavipes]|nr:uncharacterized protein TNCV_2828811 [Trichonephila clavipes]
MGILKKQLNRRNYNDVSSYLCCIFDNKLKWSKHVEHVVSKARKRLPILKRLAGAEWECGRATLNITYKNFVQPVLNYCNEVLVSALNKVLGILAVFPNQALRLITGSVKTTAVLAMHLLCDLQPMTNLIWKSADILNIDLLDSQIFPFGVNTTDFDDFYEMRYPDCASSLQPSILFCDVPCIVALVGEEGVTSEVEIQ